MKAVKRAIPLKESKVSGIGDAVGLQEATAWVERHPRRDVRLLELAAALQQPPSRERRRTLRLLAASFQVPVRIDFIGSRLLADLIKDLTEALVKRVNDLKEVSSPDHPPTYSPLGAHSPLPLTPAMSARLPAPAVNFATPVRMKRSRVRTPAVTPVIYISGGGNVVSPQTQLSASAARMLARSNAC